MEEQIVAGLLGWGTNGHFCERNSYLTMADGAISDYVNYFIDPVYGEVYRMASAGSEPDTTKGYQYESGYHSLELGYYAALYTALFVRHEPMTLYYRIRPTTAERTIVLTPIEIGDNQLRIASVQLDGVEYGNFKSRSRALSIPSAVGGVFAVTFEATDL